MEFIIKKCFLLLIAAVITLAVSPLAKAAPNLVNYQGAYVNAQGAPVTGSKVMVFRIYPALDTPAANALWNSGNVTVAVVNGAFSVNLGESPQTALPADLFAASDTRYIGVTVDGAELVPRQRLTSVPYALNAGAAVPRGIIAMWSGSVAAIPQGWALCDGTNGRPDLRDRFIIGAGSTGYKTPGTTGGVNTSTIPEHSHTISGIELQTSTVPDHAHYVSLTTTSENGRTKVDDEDDDDTVADDNHEHSVQGNTNPSGSHSHTIASHNHGGATSASGGLSLDNRPPFYALCFIIKL